MMSRDNQQHQPMSERRRRMWTRLLPLFLLSGLVVYLYNAFLEEGFYESFESESEPQPEYELSEEQRSTARKLKIEMRVLQELIKTVWTECRLNSWTGEQCKEFIDQDILEVFANTEDANMKTYIVEKRSEADEWYNCVVLIMDDNDIVLGRDGDGLVYYDFVWDSSGVAATPEQETQIPPVSAVETTSGAEEGNNINTIYAPQTTTTTEAPPPPGQSPGDPNNPEATFPPGFLGPETEGVTTPAATGPTVTDATQPTVTTTTVTTTVSVTVAATVVGTQAPNNVISGGQITTTTAATVPVTFQQPPIEVEEENVLVEGSTVDEAIAGTATNPINGGVVLDPAAESDPEAMERLNQQLAQPPDEMVPGPRDLGEFDCTGLTGYDCCLLVKHRVRDADVNGKAIQCFLDYEESTCKKEWWRTIVDRRRVMIYENHNGKVTRDPVVEGSWVACEEKFTNLEHDWSAPVCRAPANVCIAIDMSGSVCSPNFHSPTQCKSCHSNCWEEDLHHRDTCCENFYKEEQFAAWVMNNLVNSANFGTDDKQFSLVTFATNGAIEAPLGSSQDALTAINNMDYTGGLTNHERALVLCQDTLPTGPDDPPPFVILVTDGIPTTFGRSCTNCNYYSNDKPRRKGRQAADELKGNGINIATVFINPLQADQDTIQYMKDLSSDDSFFSVSNFEDIGEAVKKIAENVGCGAVAEAQ